MYWYAARRARYPITREQEWVLKLLWLPMRLIALGWLGLGAFVLGLIAYLELPRLF